MEPNTGYYAKIIADSVTEIGTRLTTMEICFPRFILAEFNTHRVFSRNSASSRAIPVAKQIERITKYPFVPAKFPKNEPGMSASANLEGDAADQARHTWMWARDQAVKAAETLMLDGVHKQTANRLLEPFAWHTVVVSATEWENFYALRDNENAQPEIQIIAMAMRDAMEESAPRLMHEHHWHLPYVTDEEYDTIPESMLLKYSVARCARVSYLTHGEGKLDLKADEALHDRLLASGHMSPFEHQATPGKLPRWLGNFYGWTQYRKLLPGENVYAPPLT